MQEIFDLIWNYITLNWVDIIIFIYSLTTTIIAIVKAKKNKNEEELRELLTTELIPLMEEVEQKIGYTGEDKEQWVIKKLAEKLHLDLFKYKKILAFIKELIADICKTTKIEINKTKVVEDNTKGGADNGQEIY